MEVVVATEEYLYSGFRPGQRVRSVEGFPGTVTEVQDGPGNNTVIVRLDNGMGGGEYQEQELTPLNTTDASGHDASVDYPELGSILTDRPDLQASISEDEYLGRTASILKESLAKTAEWTLSLPLDLAKTPDPAQSLHSTPGYTDGFTQAQQGSTREPASADSDYRTAFAQGWADGLLIRPPEVEPPTTDSLDMGTELDGAPRMAALESEGGLIDFIKGSPEPTKNWAGPGHNWSYDACFLPEAPVMMSDGTERPISEVLVGNWVLSHTGDVRRVTRVGSRPYDGDIVRATVSGDGTREVVATDEHRFWAANQDFGLVGTRGSQVNLSPESGWMQIGDLEVGDYLSRSVVTDEHPVVVTFAKPERTWSRYGAKGVIRRPDKKKQWAFVYRQDGRSFSRSFDTLTQAQEASDVHHVPEFMDIKIDQDIAWLLGLYAGDGSRPIKSGYTVSFSVNSDQTDIKDRIAAIAQTYFGVSSFVYPEKNKQADKIDVRHWALHALVGQMVGDGSSTKVLDGRLLRMPLSEQQAFMDGYTEADGYDRSDGGHNFSSTSFIMARQMREVLTRLGITSTIRLDTRGKDSYPNAKPSLRVEWWNSKNRLTRQFIADEQVWQQITSLKRERYIGEVWDIEVDGDHSFRAYGMNVHNCRFRKNSRCMYPKELNKAATDLAGYAVWVPEDRGWCSRVKWEDQQKCNVYEPGPHMAGGFTDATVPWEEGGQRGGHVASITDTVSEVSGIVREFAQTPTGTDFFADEADDLSRAYRDLPVLDPHAAALWIELGALCVAQAESLKAGYQVIRCDNSDPYATSDEMYADIDKGIYKVTSLHSNHPVWDVDTNVAFRVVHDLTGHAPSHSDFSLLGEVTAYQNQCAQTPEHLWPVLFTEIVAQSAYANVHHLFGEQKVGLIPLTQDEIDAHVGTIMDAPDAAYDALHRSASVVTASTPIPWDQVTWQVLDSVETTFLYARLSDKGIIGRISWANRTNGKAKENEIQWIQVTDEYERQGLGTELLRRARQINPAVKHSDLLSHDGREFSQAVASLSADGFGFHYTAAWRDVRAKAKRIRASGKIRVLSSLKHVMACQVQGDNHVYQVEVHTVPGRYAVAAWVCGCAWAAYSWGRTGPWKKYEGRMCSHALAAVYEAQSRGMFGKVIGEDEAAPAWVDKSKVKIDGDWSRDLGRYSVRSQSDNDSDNPWKIVETMLLTGMPVVEVHQALLAQGVTQHVASSGPLRGQVGGRVKDLFFLDGKVVDKDGNEVVGPVNYPTYDPREGLDFKPVANPNRTQVASKEPTMSSEEWGLWSDMPTTARKAIATEDEWGLSAELNDEPEPALPTTDGADDPIFPDYKKQKPIPDADAKAMMKGLWPAKEQQARMWLYKQTRIPGVLNTHTTDQIWQTISWAHPKGDAAFGGQPTKQAAENQQSTVWPNKETCYYCHNQLTYEDTGDGWGVYRDSGGDDRCSANDGGPHECLGATSSLKSTSSASKAAKDPHAWLMDGNGDADVAARAQEFLSKKGMKNFSAGERAQIIGEGEGSVAGNLGMLDLTGTHYQAQADLEGVTDDEMGIF